jgi:oligosaccharide repeat unit polymerase
MIGVGLLGLLSLVVVWTYLNRRLFGDPVSPFNLLLLGWVGPLALRGLHLSDQERAWPLSTVALMVVVSVMLALGIVLLRPRSTSVTPRQRSLFLQLMEELRRPSLLLALAAIYVVSFIAYLYNEFYTNPVGIPVIAYLRDPTTALGNYHRWGKEEGRTFGLYLSLPLQVLIPLWYVAYRANRGRPMARWFLVFVLAYPVMSLLKLSRSDVLAVAISIGLTEHYIRLYAEPARAFRFTPARLARYGAMAVLLIVALNSLLLVRAGFSAGGRGFADLIGLRVDAGPLSSTIGEIYGYVAMPVENFANVLRLDLHGSFIGVGPLRPLFSLLGQSGLAEARMEHLDLDAVLLYPINTYSFLTLTYVELGIAGVIIVPFCYGLFIGALYRRFRNRPTVVALSLYLVFLPCWLWLFAINGFGVLSFYLQAAFVLMFVVLARALQLIARRTPGFAGRRGYAT